MRDKTLEGKIKKKVYAEEEEKKTEKNKWNQERVKKRRE